MMITKEGHLTPHPHLRNRKSRILSGITWKKGRLISSLVIFTPKSNQEESLEDQLMRMLRLRDHLHQLLQPRVARNVARNQKTKKEKLRKIPLIKLKRSNQWKVKLLKR
uniref:Uncharacterized protein n=1 Tax=Ciona intestinalis TaxID=7719 RepID=H2XVB7_CIOIN